MLDYIMIFYFSFYLIPVQFIHRSDSILVYLPGIIFGICMYLYLHYIDKFSYSTVTFTYIIWIIFSRFHFGLIVSRLAHVGPVLKFLIFWGVFLGCSYYRIYTVFGKEYKKDFILAYNKIKARFFNTKTENNGSKDTDNETNSENAKKESGSNNSYHKSENWETFRKRFAYDISCEEAAEKFFENCKTEEERKSVYRHLMKIYHPDQPNGNPELCKAIQSVYERF